MEGELGVFAPTAKQTPNRPQRNTEIKTHPWVSPLALARKTDSESFRQLAFQNLKGQIATLARTPCKPTAMLVDVGRF